MNWFSEEVKSLEWKKKRELPEWAQTIFSENMVAAGNVQDEKEIDQIVTLASKTIDYYMNHPDEARSKAETCRWEKDGSSECVNALTAVKKLDEKYGPGQLDPTTGVFTPNT